MKQLKTLILINGAAFTLLLFVLHYGFYHELGIDRIFWLSATVISFIDFTILSVISIYITPVNRYSNYI